MKFVFPNIVIKDLCFDRNIKEQYMLKYKDRRRCISLCSIALLPKDNILDGRNYKRKELSAFSNFEAF